MKYFEFKDTISGMSYLLRNLIATLFAYSGGFLIGWGMAQAKIFTQFWVW